jgi:hypothetical protein
VADSHLSRKSRGRLRDPGAGAAAKARGRRDTVGVLLYALLAFSGVV